MKKLLKFLDTYSLKILISFLLIFTVLYPKLPTFHIIRTWVYIRLEDFVILATVFIWLIQLLRRKAPFPSVLGYSIGAYWLIGLISVISSIFFIGPSLANYYPHLAFLNYLRRVEYMFLFFVAFSTIRSPKDIRDYFVILSVSLIGIVSYGFGQRYYIYLWEKFPEFFKNLPFCFPSFQTGNEEFAKGMPLCLPYGARITSTFGGHYDLAAYLVLITPVMLAVSLSLKKYINKILTFALFVAGVILLIFTASRISFASYLVAVISTLAFYRKKLFIIPVLILSIFLLIILSESTAKRFLSTIRITSIVTNKQGQMIGEALPQDLKNKISENQLIQGPPPAQNLPVGSGFIGLPDQTTQVATNVAVIKKTLSSEEASKLKLAAGSIQISTVSGSFLIKQALVYDISFTTRFQAEWPNAWKAFLRNPLIGSGYSSISLATDNDYFRALGETGLLGLISFLFIFLILGITFKERSPSIDQRLVKGFVYGVAGGVVGLMINAILIDVFEASKVAESLWIILGIGTGALLLYMKKPVSYKENIKKVFSSNIFISIYLFCLLLAGFLKSIGNFFVADDFTWLRWAASSIVSDIPRYFTDSQNFFYRPLDKTIVFYLYTLFSFQPQGYHVFILLLHFFTTLGVYFLARSLFENVIARRNDEAIPSTTRLPHSLSVARNDKTSKLSAFLAAVLFLFLPAHSENLYWFSTISVTLSSLFIIYAAIAFFHFRKNNSIPAYLLTIVISILAFLSYELAVVIPLLFILIDVTLIKPKKNISTFLSHLPFIILVPLYFIVRNLTHAFSGGGDYSYNISNLIPNIFGNTFGYIGLFLTGEVFLPVYNALRTNLRVNILLFTVIFIFILSAVIFIITKYKKEIIKSYKDNNIKIIFFGIIFGFISLLPYLALGNIAPRYIYLASSGFAISFILLLRLIKNRFIFLPLVTAIIIIFLQMVISENNQWEKAGEITKNMLIDFRIDYRTLTSASNIYFVNAPMKLNNAWVFPVGLPDSLWFIYRESMPEIYQVSAINEAKIKIQKQGTLENYIFIFDKEGKIQRIKF